MTGVQQSRGERVCGPVRRRGRTRQALAVAAALWAAGCATAGGGSNGASVEIGELAPALEVTGWDGSRINLADLKGKVVLLDIWASWCVPCRDEMPVLDDLAVKLRSRGVEVLAVSIDEERGAADAFLRSRKKWSLTLAHDPSSSVPNRLQPPKMPSSYIIDRAGIIRYMNAGYEPGDAARLETQLRSLLD